jgi:hypothetical protein
MWTRSEPKLFISNIASARKTRFAIMLKMMWVETEKVDSEGNAVEFVAKKERRVSLNMAFLRVETYCNS